MGNVGAGRPLKTFDERADGFVRSEGCAVVVLKRLSDALAQNDPVLAVIRGSAVNQDGRSAGMTAPNRQAQERVLRDALARARVAPGNVGYVETHGSGTALGDPIEVEAVASVYGANAADSPCLLGAVKSNIGHTEAAAGAAGLIKTVLALVHEWIPATPALPAVKPKPAAGRDSLTGGLRAKAVVPRRQQTAFCSRELLRLVGYKRPSRPPRSTSRVERWSGGWGRTTRTGRHSPALGEVPRSDSAKWLRATPIGWMAPGDSHCATSAIRPGSGAATGHTELP